VNGGYLGGTGIIGGAVTLNSAGTIAPGTASTIGKLRLNTAPTLIGTNFSRIDRNGGSSISDQLSLTGGGATPLTYGGTLIVSNAGATLVGGEVFTNFSANSYSGSFTTTILPALSAGLNWYLGKLTNNGTIRVNRQPVANIDFFTNTPSLVVQIPISSLVTNDTDPDADVNFVSGINLTTTNGVTLTTNSTFINYSNFVNVTDRFTYVISDGSGGSSTGIVQIAASPTVNVPPSISAQPQSQTVKISSNVLFSVTAAGTPAPEYQWQFNGSPISGATANSYTRSNAQLSSAGNYSVIVSNTSGVIFSSNAALTVLPLAPMWIQSITPLIDGRMTLVVTGEPGYAYSVDRSTNLSAWHQITNLLNTNGTSSFTDDDATNNGAGFYRTRQ
jgi:hypothetical protein